MYGHAFYLKFFFVVLIYIMLHWQVERRTMIGAAVVVQVVQAEQGRIGLILAIHAAILVEWTPAILEILVMWGQSILVICEEIRAIPEVV
jgi:hypothetical protein